MIASRQQERSVDVMRVLVLVLPIPAVEVSDDQDISVPDGTGCFPPPVKAFVEAYIRTAAEDEAQTWLRSVKDKLRKGLNAYRIASEVVGERLTPNTALIRIKGTDSMTVAEVEKRRGVLLTSHGLDVIGVRPERGEVIVIVARDHRSILNLCESSSRRVLPASAPEHNTSFLIGERENNGELFYLNLGGKFEKQPMHGPHTLIASETGGGKGVLIRNLILEICAINAPENA